MRVLVVEDSPANLRLMEVLLARAGHQVVGAGSVAAARRELAAGRPDLILLDLQLPDGDGLDLAADLKADPGTASVPIIAVTAYAMPEDEAAALQAGCEGYLSKPINTRTFCAQIQAVLGQPRWGRQGRRSPWREC